MGWESCVISARCFTLIPQVRKTAPKPAPSTSRVVNPDTAAMMTVGRAMSVAPDGTRIIHASTTVGRASSIPAAFAAAAALKPIAESEEAATPAATPHASAGVSAAASEDGQYHRPSALDAFAQLGKAAPAPAAVAPAAVPVPAAPAPAAAAPAPPQAGAGLSISGVTTAPAASAQGSFRSFNSFQGLSHMSWERANPFTRLVTIAAICNRSRFAEADEATVVPIPNAEVPAHGAAPSDAAARKAARKARGLKKPGVDFGAWGGMRWTLGGLVLTLSPPPHRRPAQGAGRRLRGRPAPLRRQPDAHLRVQGASEDGRERRGHV